MKKKRFLKLAQIIIIGIVAVGMIGTGALSIFGVR